MKIKRFFAADIRQAMRLVREAQGPDAVILSNRKVDGGVEIVSAVDLDDTVLSASTGKETATTASLLSNKDTDPSFSPERTIPFSPGTTQPIPISPRILAASKENTVSANKDSVSRPESSTGSSPSAGGRVSTVPSSSPTPAPSRPNTGTNTTSPNKPATSLNARPNAGGGNTRPVSSKPKPTVPGSKPIQPSPPQTSSPPRVPAYDPPASSPPVCAAWSETEANQDNESNNVNDFRYPGDSTRISRATDTLWAPDPVLAGMRDELKELRGLLEHQLSGLVWGETIRRTPVQARLLRALTELGLSMALTRELAESVGEIEDFDNAWRQAMTNLAGRLEVTEDAILGPGGVVALVGATGVGKTTTVAKLAAHYALRHGREKVGLITTDGYRIGSQEQLRTFARILGSPMRTAANAAELTNALEELGECELILIDTTGMGQRDLRLSEHLSSLRSAGRGIRSYLVLSAVVQRAGLDEVVRVFSSMEVSGCILTKLDEAASLGEILSVVVRQRLPVTYLGIGQRVPEDLVPARAHNLVSRAVALLQHYTPEVEEETLAMAFGSTAHHAATF